jgi:hypothetical protein
MAPGDRGFDACAPEQDDGSEPHPRAVRTSVVALDRDPVSPLVLAAFEGARMIEPPAVSRAGPR